MPATKNARKPSAACKQSALSSATVKTWSSHPLPLGDTPNDTIAAIAYLRNLIPFSVTPLVLISQVYSIISNNTVVDRDIDAMCKAGVLRRFRIGSSRLAVMLMTDYLHQIEDAKREVDALAEGSEKLMSLYDRYHAFIASGHHDAVDITKQMLFDTMKATDNDISLLLKSDFLTHKSLSEYTISPRSAGLYWGSYQRARTKFISWIKRKQFKQVPESQLEVKKFGAGKKVLDTRLILADLSGSGYIEAEKTPMGNTYKLTRKADDVWMSGGTRSSRTSAGALTTWSLYTTTNTRYTIVLDPTFTTSPRSPTSNRKRATVMDIDERDDIHTGPSAISDNKAKRQRQRLQVNHTSFDLDALNSYAGHAKVERLIFIAERCPPLQIEAYRLAAQHLKADSMNVARYVLVTNRLNEALSAKGQPTVPVDSQWVDKTTKEAKLKTEKLEAELKNYKNNMIKESIRMGHNDLGDHYYNCGDASNALKCYSRTRDYVTTPKHIADMCMNVIRVSIELGNFAHVQSYVMKAESTPDVPDKNILMAKLKASSGLVNLDSQKFKRAAKYFLETSFELQYHYSEIISPNDIAVYGGLCALASFDRTELRTKVFENSDFKQYLELEPTVRELLYSFYNSKYTVCLEIMNRMKNDLQLDFYLSSHIDMLMANIRKKALIQYFSPFGSVDMNKMAAAFNTNIIKLEPEIAVLIQENAVQARIDSHNKVLRVKKTDQRTKIFEKSLEMGADYEKQTKYMLLRMRLIKSDLIVREER
ncbi:hypothetical protein SeLEV6574_g02253 [Synchytrium endobioticum]|uniref:PCI domain-containing protein n=1 Tax=Synchytrium endobioticum TaxID=286115 RepID=A0A507D9F2_9FUNG|nr:hypothetical protein SeLEV6574_g02253 [Synchytrium endobioticum]